MMTLVLQIINFILALIILYRIELKKRAKATESEFFSDYIKGDLILRVFKPEYEYQAIGDIDRKKFEVLERGNLSQFYMWALIARK